MRILHFCTSEDGGGAENNAHRIHTYLRNAGHSSCMLVKNKSTNDPNVFRVAYLVSKLGRVFKLLKRQISFIEVRMPKANYTFNYDISTNMDFASFYKLHPGKADIIFLHWINGFLTSKAIRQIYQHYRCPIVWFLCDMEPMTGGCHYSFGCDRFMEQCGKCPCLNSHSSRDWSRMVWKKKDRYLHDLPITFVNGGNWVLEKLRQSSLFKKNNTVQVPGCFDTNIFRPLDQRIAREVLQIPQGKKIIFFGAIILEDPRKGVEYILKALKKLSAKLRSGPSLLKPEDVFLLVAGRDNGDLRQSLPFESKYLGYLKDEITLALAYQAADIFVNASLEDVGPGMVVESMLCRTPVVSFNTGFCPEVIHTMSNGYLARKGDSDDLANGMYNLLTAVNFQEIRDAAYSAVKDKHSSSMAISAYIKLFESLVSARK
jgi:glycosyltransferase involved in cell wall biosynthesis